MAGLYLYRSNLVENLSEFLSANLLVEPLADPLAKEYVVVGSRGMEQWLKRRLSERLGIVSNIEFPFPTAHLGEALEKLTSTEDTEDEESSRAWSPDALMWSIVKALPELIEHDSFQPIVDYLGDDPERSADPITDPAELADQLKTIITRKELGLSRQIADLFDRYITYRADWAVQWSQGKSASDPSMGSNNPCPWQPMLWQNIENTLGEQNAHVATRLTKLDQLAQLSPEEAKARLGYSRLSIFGTPSVPKSYLQILAKLSELIDVHLYILCPSNTYWGDLRNSREKAKQYLDDRVEFSGALRELFPEGNPLLLSLGRVARDFQTVLLELPNEDRTFNQPQASHRDLKEIDAFLDPIVVEERSHQAILERLEALPGKADGIRSIRANNPALARLQSEIFHLRHPKAIPDEERSLSPNDDSIQIHSCHSPTRQVEVLKEAIFHLLERHRHLEPRDIVVMTPDIETYAPLIRAIFDEGQEKRSKSGWGAMGGPRLPYRLADLSLRRLNPVADALMRVLELATDRVEATTILDLLSLEPVQRRFNIDPNDLTTIQTWLDESGIRWGINAKHRANHNQPEDVTNTWQFGLEKLALGVTMAREAGSLATTEASFDDPSIERVVTPFDDIEGQKTELLGNFLAFTSALFEQMEIMQEPCDIQTWIERLVAAIQAMTRTPQKASFLTRRVLDVIKALESDSAQAECSTEVTLQALKNYLDGRFEVEATRQNQRGGAVTFGGLLAVRSIPHKVVVLLGMDEGEFPRNPTIPRFDLTSHRPRVGDRDPRDEDRMLLLEALMSAREHLMILYSGRNVRTNDHQEPATPIAELFDVLNQTFAQTDNGQSPVEAMTTEHPLQPFSPKNFMAYPRLTVGEPNADHPGQSAWSFSENHLDASTIILSAEKNRPSFFEPGAAQNLSYPEEIQLEQFTQCLLQPVRSFFKNKEGLNLNLKDYSSALSDREPIILDGLEGWKLAENLLEEKLEEQSATVSDLLGSMRSTGTLPLGTPGRQVFDEKLKGIEAGVKTFESIIQNKTQQEPIAINLPLDQEKTRIQGQLNHCWDNELVYLFNGKESPKRLLGPWLDYLVATAQAPEQVEKANIVLCHWDFRKAKAVSTHYVIQYKCAAEERRAKAIEELTFLLQWYLKAQIQPIPLIEKSSYAFADKIGDLFNAEDFETQCPTASGYKPQQQFNGAITKAANSWKSTDQATQATTGEGTDPHLELIWPDEGPHKATYPDPIDHEFAWHALRLWQPMFENSEKMEAPVSK